MPLSLREMESHIYVPPAENCSVDKEFKCGIRVNCKKSFIKSSIFKRQQAVLLIVYYLLNLEEKDAFKPFRGATIVHVLLSYRIIMIHMCRLFSSLLLAYVISIIYILQLGGVNCHCLIVQNCSQNIGNV